MGTSKVKRILTTLSTIIFLTLLLQFSVVAAEDFPRSIHLSWQNDPSTTMTIMWRSELGATGMVEYGGDLDQAQTIESETHGYRFGRTDVYWHTAEITGLEPNTTYHYRLSTSEPWQSEEYTFKTAIPKGKDMRFRFAVMTDAQGSYDNQRKAFERIKNENVDFLLYLGDFTDTGNQQEWDVWFGTGEGVLNGLPMLSVLGNHEGDQRTYWEQMALPDHERWYSLDYGNVHFVFLNTNVQAEIERQVPWLLDDLQNSDNTWTIAMGHHPFYSSVISKPEYDFLRDSWLDGFEKYGVNLYFSGHNHCYERTWPIKAGQIDDNGIIHVVHGPAGGKFYSVEPAWWSNVIHPDTSMYSVYTVNGLQIQGIATSVDGVVIDQFQLER